MVNFDRLLTNDALTLRQNRGAFPLPSLGEGGVRVDEHSGIHNVGVGRGPTLGQVLDLPLQSRLDW